MRLSIKLKLTSGQGKQTEIGGGVMMSKGD